MSLISLRLPRVSLQIMSELHTSVTLRASNIIQFPLAQTGEGIKECELTEWFVEVGAGHRKSAKQTVPKLVLSSFAL